MEAQAAARQTIQKYWPQALPERPPIYRTKTANAQEAHEAIRPTDTARTPKPLREALSSDQAALYEIIWRRFIASQMKPALYNVIGGRAGGGKSGQPVFVSLRWAHVVGTRLSGRLRGGRGRPGKGKASCPISNPGRRCGLSNSILRST